MPQSKLKLVNTNQVWDAKRRYKINETCTYNSINYQNATGSNSEPGVGNDWIATNPTIKGIFDTNTYTSLPVTTEQILSVKLIPANTFSDLDAVQLKALLIKPLENGVVLSLSAYLNTSASLVGANKLLETIVGNSGLSTLNVFIINTFINVIKNNTIKGTTKYGLSGVTLNQLINFSSSPNPTELPFNPTINNYLIIAVSLASDLDVITQESLIFKKIN